MEYVPPPSSSQITFPSRREFEDAIDIVANGHCPNGISVQSIEELLKREWLGTNVNIKFYIIFFYFKMFF